MHFGIGYELEVRGRTREIEQRAFNNVLAQISMADELGYHSAWFVEHHFTRGFSHSSAPDLVLAAAARETRNIRLGLGVVLLPFSHPVRTAERIATLDVLSHGRVEFGTGRGASPLEYQVFQQPFEQSRRLWEVNVDTVLQILAADGEPVTIENEYWTIPSVGVYPRPVQEPYPPVWVASTSLDGFVAAAQRGFNLMVMPMVKGIDGLAEDLDVYRTTLEKSGFDPASRRVAAMIPWHVAATRDAARKTASDSLMWYMRRQLTLVVPPDTYDARHATYRVFGHEALDRPNDEAVDVLCEHLMVVIDDVESSRRAVARLQSEGITDVLCQFQVGGLDNDAVMNSINLFATEVAEL
jgi:natural product biosynthesis luciferase-like monooxygenase protein